MVAIVIKWAWSIIKVSAYVPICDSYACTCDCDSFFTHRMHLHMHRLVEMMRSDLKSHCAQCGTMSVCNKHVGAPLISTETGEVVSKEQLMIAMKNGDENLVMKDPATGLFYPGTSTRMKSANGSSRSIPPNYAINPMTGHVVRIEGNVCYDVTSRQFVFTCDCPHKNDAISLDIGKSPMIPFLPHPLNAETGEPLETGLKAMAKQLELKLGGPMMDPVTGLVVPICAVTIHPHSHCLLPIGGTHIDPVSNLPIPIELGSMILDPSTSLPVPILGVTIDASSGRIKPVGGSIINQDTDSTSTTQKTILIGDSATEPLSQLPVRITSAVAGINDDHYTLEPAFGGYKTYIDSVELKQENMLIKMLVHLQDLVRANGNKDENVSFADELRKVHAFYENVISTRIRNQTYYLAYFHSLLMKKDRFDKLASTGGSPGYMEFKPTGQPLPLLVGQSIPDELEGVQVPVLGYEIHPVTGIAEPLAGTFESTHGGERIPIMIGEKVYDESTKELAPICGAKRNPESGVVIPIIQEPLCLIQARKKSIAKSVVRLSKQQYHLLRNVPPSVLPRPFQCSSPSCLQ